MENKEMKIEKNYKLKCSNNKKLSLIADNEMEKIIKQGLQKSKYDLQIMYANFTIYLSRKSEIHEMRLGNDDLVFKSATKFITSHNGITYKIESCGRKPKKMIKKLIKIIEKLSKRGELSFKVQES